MENEVRWQFTDKQPVEYTLFDGRYTVRIDGFFKPIYEAYFSDLSVELLEYNFFLWKHTGKIYKTAEEIELVLNSRIAHNIYNYEKAYPSSPRVKEMHRKYTYRFT